MAVSACTTALIGWQLFRSQVTVHCSQQCCLVVRPGAKADRVGKSSSPQPAAEAGKGNRKRGRSPEARNGRDRGAKDSSRAEKESSRKRSARDEAGRGSRRAEVGQSDRRRSSRGSDAQRGSLAERDKRRKKDSPKPDRARDSKADRDAAGSGKQAGRQSVTAEGSSAERDAPKEAAAAGPSGSTKQQGGDPAADAAVAPEAGRHSGAAQKAPEADLAAAEHNSTGQGPDGELPPPPPPGAPSAGACLLSRCSALAASASVLEFLPGERKQPAVSTRALYSCGVALACRQDAAHGSLMMVHCLAMCAVAALLLGTGPTQLYLVTTILSVCGPMCIRKLMVFPAVPGPPSHGDIKATGAQAAEEEHPPEDMEVDPNPAGQGLRALHGLGMRSAGFLLKWGEHCAPGCSRGGAINIPGLSGPAVIQLLAPSPPDILCT